MGGDGWKIGRNITIFVVVCCAATGFGLAQAIRWGITSGRISVPNEEHEREYRQFWGAVIAYALLWILASACLWGAMHSVAVR